MNLICHSEFRDKLVSIVLPTFNGGKFIALAIESALNQRHSNIEVLIIDDGSNDDTSTIVASFKDPRIRYIQKDNSGLQKTLNYAIPLLNGEYFARLDADDYIDPDHIKNALEILENSRCISAVFSLWKVIDGKGDDLPDCGKNYPAISFSHCRKLLPYRNCLVGPSLVIRSEVLKEFKYANWAAGMEDYHLSLRLVAAGHQFGFTGKPSYIYRRHAESITARTNYKDLMLRQAAIKFSGLAVGVMCLEWGHFHMNLLIQAFRDFGYGLKRVLSNAQ